MQPGERAPVERAEQVRDVGVEVGSVIGTPGGWGDREADGRVMISSISASIASSTASGSLRPSAATIFTPLSVHGLWLAETIAAGTPCRWARKATAGVGATPSDVTCAPSAAKPARQVGDDAGPRLARVAPDEELADAEHTRRRAPSATTSGGVRSVSALPRTPSVPNRSTARPG